jgi:hypothetical protein
LTRACGIVLECTLVRETKRVTQCVLSIADMAVVNIVSLNAEDVSDRGLNKYFADKQAKRLMLRDKRGDLIDLYLGTNSWVLLPVNAVIDASEILVITLTSGAAHLVMLPRGRIMVRNVALAIVEEPAIHDISQVYKILTSIELAGSLHCPDCDEMLTPLSPCDCDAHSRTSPSKSAGLLVAKLKLKITFEDGQVIYVDEEPAIRDILRDLHAEVHPDIADYINQVGGGFREIPIKGVRAGSRIQVDNEKQILTVVDIWRWLRDS